MKFIEGTLPENDLRRAFVNGAKWWEFHETGATMWQSDRNLAEAEAEKRYPGGKDNELAATRAALDAAGELIEISQALTYNELHWKEEKCSQCYRVFIDGHAPDCYFTKLHNQYTAALTRLDATRGEAG